MCGHMCAEYSPSVHSVNGPVHSLRWGAGVYSANEPVQALRVGRMRNYLIHTLKSACLDTSLITSTGPAVQACNSFLISLAIDLDFVIKMVKLTVLG